jgi:hypothetical protein
MAETSAHERRAAARQQRRARTEQSKEPTPDAVAEAAELDPGEALRTAASAALAGAAVGAAQALARRRRPPADQDEEEPATHDVHDEQVAADDPDEQPPQAEREPEPPQSREGTPPAEARRVVERAREQLRELRGVEAESVSSVRRLDDGWRIGLEVVELHRIPESTDVLGTYEVDLDGDGNLITFQRTSRYHRSEADRR